MLRIILDNPQSDWASARLIDGDQELVRSGSHTPADAISDLVETVEGWERQRQQIAAGPKSRASCAGSCVAWISNWRLRF